MSKQYVVIEPVTLHGDPASHELNTTPGSFVAFPPGTVVEIVAEDTGNGVVDVRAKDWFGPGEHLDQYIDKSSLQELE
ncbi:hypothetical protein SEA_BACHOME_60 [Mycobacterium phage Bachome]|nr:hypothetical protein SEA_BACHOME_60 [Mycobacterium phage Bachome]UXE05104.1 hypothetical protein SEA_MACH_59 [Mycobacterium phage MaCh]